MIWGIHYFITKLKKKIDVIPRSCFNFAIGKQTKYNAAGIDQIFEPRSQFTKYVVIMSNLYRSIFFIHVKIKY